MLLKRIVFACLHPLWRIFDTLLPKRPDYWAFATHHLHTDRFVENQRALFEHVKDDAAIRKVIFYRGPRPDFGIEGGTRYDIVEHGSLRGLILLARCRVVFVTHSIAMDFSLRWGDRRFSILKLAMNRRLVVNLWHGIPLKRLLNAANEGTQKHTDRVRYRQYERRHYAGLIASSDVDSYAMAAMFYPLGYRQIWITGLPRNDFLTADEAYLPRYIRDSIHALRAIRQGKKLVIYAPTYRQIEVSAGAAYYQFADHEIKRLKAVLEANNAILGYRPHYFRNSSTYFNLDRYIDNRLIFDLSHAVIPEFSAVARECDLLITDYSSVYIETLYLGKPAICFCYDLDHYKAHQDGLLYDLSLVFPGPICRTFDETLDAIGKALAGPAADADEKQAFIRQFFFNHCDSSNSERVRQRVLQLLSRSRRNSAP